MCSRLPDRHPESKSVHIEQYTNYNNWCVISKCTGSLQVWNEKDRGTSKYRESLQNARAFTIGWKTSDVEFWIMFWRRPLVLLTFLREILFSISRKNHEKRHYLHKIGGCLCREIGVGQEIFIEILISEISTRMLYLLYTASLKYEKQ